MNKLTSAFLVTTLFLAPVLAAAQTGGGAGGTQAPGSGPSDRPTGSPGIRQPMPPGSGTTDAPAARPPSAFDLSRHNTRADCEKAGGRWGEVSQSCTQK
jgi:hypothetical protein